MTEPQDLESRLRASQLYNRSIIESCPAAMVVVDPNLTISDVNQEAVKLTGYTRRELIGSPLEAHFAVPARAEQGVREMLHTRAISTFDFVLKSRAGEERPIPVSAALFWDPDGEPRGLLVATGR